MTRQLLALTTAWLLAGLPAPVFAQGGPIQNAPPDPTATPLPVLPASPQAPPAQRAPAPLPSGPIAPPSQSLEPDPRSLVRVDGVSANAAQYGMRYESMLTEGALRLRGGGRAELWRFDAEAGQCIMLRMESQDLDPYLVLRAGAPDGPVVAEDDDSGGAPNALITGQMPATGAYYVIATTFSDLELGRYTLLLSAC